jgi:CBS domain-containing protein
MPIIERLDSRLTGGTEASGPTVADAMHLGLVTCPADAVPRSLAQLMHAHGVHHLIVLDGDATVGIISDADLLRHAGSDGAVSAGDIARPAFAKVDYGMSLVSAADMLYTGQAELLIVYDVDREVPLGAMTAADLAGFMALPEAPIDKQLAADAPITEVMRHGVVLVDPGASAQEVARAMRDARARLAVVLDLEGEAMGIIDQRALLKGWGTNDQVKAAALMETDVVTIPPNGSLAEAAAIMAEAGLGQALVEPPLPQEWSGRWSTWKERGVPRGLLSAEAILNAVHDLAPSAASVGTPPTATARVMQRRQTLLFVGVLALLILVAVGIFFVAGNYHVVVCSPTQVGHARC